MYIGVHVNCLLFLSDFNENLNSLDGFSKNSQTSNFMEVLPVGAESFLTDRRTDKRTLIVAFLNFCECAKNFLFYIFKDTVLLFFLLETK